MSFAQYEALLMQRGARRTRATRADNLLETPRRTQEIKERTDDIENLRKCLVLRERWHMLHLFRVADCSGGSGHRLAALNQIILVVHKEVNIKQYIELLCCRNYFS